MTVNARCPRSNKTVAAHAMLADDEVKKALEGGESIEVIHFTAGEGDHKWPIRASDHEFTGLT